MKWLDKMCLNLWEWDESDDFEELMSALRDQSNVIQLVDIGDATISNLSEDQMVNLCELLGSLGCLKEFRLALNAAGATKLHFPLPALTMITEGATTLRRLDLKDVELAGAMKDWKEWVSSLRSHQNLQDVCFENCSCIAGSAFLDMARLDELIDALSSISMLERVEILAEASKLVTDENNIKQNCVKEKTNTVSRTIGREETKLEGHSNAFCRLLKPSSSLQVLRLAGLELRNMELVGLFESLKGSKTIREVSLWQSNLDDSSVRAAASMLREQQGLEELNLDGDILLGSSGAQAIFESMHSPDAGLKRLYMCCKELDDEGKRAFLEMLRVNRSLQSFEICLCWSKEHFQPNETTSPNANVRLDGGLQGDSATLQIGSLCDTWLPLKVLTLLVGNAIGIRKLTLRDANLCGEFEDWTDWSLCLQNHLCLKELHCENVRWSADMLKVSPWHMFINSLAESNNIKVINISTTATELPFNDELVHRDGQVEDFMESFDRKVKRQKVGRMQTEVAEMKKSCKIGHLLQRLSKLEFCRVSGLEVKDDDAVFIADALRCHKALRVLDLRDAMGLTWTGCEAIFEVLQSTDAVLTDLYLACEGTQTLSSEQKAFVSMLRTNTSLINLEVHIFWSKDHGGRMHNLRQYLEDGLARELKFSSEPNCNIIGGKVARTKVV